MKRFIVTLLIIIFSASFVYASYRDVVYLKNGGIRKGIIIEQIPNQSLKIKTKDGSVFVYTYNEISKITKEKVDEVSQQKLWEYSDRKKSSLAAFALGFLLIPGAGHWYCREVGKGFEYLGLDAALTLVMFTMGISHYNYYTYYNPAFYIFSGLLIVSRVSEWIDDFAAAKRYNNKLKKKLGIPLNMYISLGTTPMENKSIGRYIALNYKF